MRLRSVFKMRISILNTATTEQMGYGILSFFVYIKSTNQLKNKREGFVQKSTILIQIKSPEEMRNPLEFNFLESHILLVHSTLPNCGFSIVRKKKKYPIPDAASERI